MNGLAVRVIAGACWLAAALATTGPGCSSEPPHPPQAGDCVPVNDASCGTPPVGGGVGPHGDAAPEGDGEVGISDAASCSVASTYFQPANPGCLPCIESECCMGLLACTSNTDCQSLLFCAQSPCDAGGAGSCLAACEANDTETVTMAYAQLAACMFMNCPQCPVLPQQPAQSDL